MRLSLRAALAGLVMVLTSGGCHTITEDLPERRSSTSNPVGPNVPLPVIVTQVPLPTPDPNPAPGQTPAPNSNPDPAPAPSSPPSGSCSLPPGSGNGLGCPRESPAFLSAVEAALDALVRQEPSLFDLTQTQGCGNCYKVLDERRYTARVAEILNQRGFCSIYDGEELAVKNSNSFNDQYDILTSGGFIRREGGSYRSTCRPASF